MKFDAVIHTLFWYMGYIVIGFIVTLLVEIATKKPIKSRLSRFICIHAWLGLIFFYILVGTDVLKEDRRY